MVPECKCCRGVEVPDDMVSDTRKWLHRDCEGRAVWLPFPVCPPEQIIPFASGLTSEAAAVHPSQISEFQRMGKAVGLNTDYDQHGSPVFRSRGERARYLKWRGLHDRDGGYRET